MKTYNQWMRNNPVKSAVVWAAASGLATCAAFRPDWMTSIMIIGIAMLALVYISIHRFERGLKVGVVVLLTLALTPGARAQEMYDISKSEPIVIHSELGDGGGAVGPSLDPKCGYGAAAGVVVIVVGAYAIYKLIKFCQRKFPREREEKEEDSLLESQEDTHAAVFGWSEIGSCAPCPSSLTGGYDGPAVTMIVEAQVREDNEGEMYVLQLEARAIDDEDSTYGFKDFRDEMLNEYGVLVEGEQGTESFARNGKPISREESMVRWDAAGFVKVGDGEHGVILQRSFDFIHWEEMMRTVVPVGTRLRFVDTTPTGRAYYRLVGFVGD